MKDNPLGPWGTAVGDQISAAIEANDWPMVAKLCVDGYLVACDKEHAATGAEINLEYIIASVMRLRYEDVVLWCAEALRRLYEEGERS
jgi:hypothetical protein